MDILNNPPQWLKDLLPEGTLPWSWWVILGFGGLVALLLLWALASKFTGLFGRKIKPPKDDLEEELESIPPAAPSTGDRRLTIDGVPVRLRLVVAAPAGAEGKINPQAVTKLLDRVVVGLGTIAENDQPRVRLWPMQYSYEGFAKLFHRNTPIPEGENEPSRWVLVCGRAKLGDRQVMLGLGLQAIKPTTIGRRTLKTHEWAETFRIKTRE